MKLRDVIAFARDVIYSNDNSDDGSGVCCGDDGGGGGGGVTRKKISGKVKVERR